VIWRGGGGGVGGCGGGKLAGGGGGQVWKQRLGFSAKEEDGNLARLPDAGTVPAFNQE